MKRFLLLFLAIGALMISACGDGIKQRPLRNQTKDVLSRGASIEDNRNFLQDKELKFWGKLNFDVYPTPTMQGRHHGGKGVASSGHPRNRMHASYKLGSSFATDDNARISQRTVFAGMTVPEIVSEDSTVITRGNSERMFLRCVETAERGRNYGMAAAMIGGYYYGWLSTVLESVNPDTKLPDEAVVDMAIKRIDKLNKYLNVELKQETDIRNTVLIQKLQNSSEQVKAIYNNPSLQSEEKYAQLLDEMRNIEAIFE